jgi:hypothetical protein
MRFGIFALPTRRQPVARFSWRGTLADDNEFVAAGGGF